MGSKSAERFAFDLIHWPKERLQELSELLGHVKESLHICPECGALTGKEGCHFCEDKKRERAVVCLVAQMRDLFLIEETREYRGLYHVISSHFHPSQGRTFHMKSVEKLKERIVRLSIQEVFLAFDATEEGDAIALFLRKELSQLPVRLSRLAFGIPLGSSFDFVDGGTLGKAISGRQTLRP